MSAMRSRSATSTGSGRRGGTLPISATSRWRRARGSSPLRSTRISPARPTARRRQARSRERMACSAARCQSTSSRSSSRWRRRTRRPRPVSRRRVLIPAGCFHATSASPSPETSRAASAATVTALNADGTGPEVPGPAQGDGGRRYSVVADVPTLDFSVTRRWGVQLWTRRSVFVGASPTGWTPDAAHPALTSAASPVPVAPLPLPLPPGVPLASLPDAEGRSHGRVRWSLPAAAPVRRVIVWECAETALRQSVGLTPRAPDTDSPAFVSRRSGRSMMRFPIREAPQSLPADRRGRRRAPRLRCRAAEGLHRHPPFHDDRADRYRN